MKKLIIATVAVLLVGTLTFAGVAFSRGGMGFGGGGFGPDPSVISRLNLTDAQASQIKALRDTFLKDIKPLQDKMFSKRGDLKLLWMKENPDQEKIAATQKEVRDLRNQIEDRMVQQRLEVFKVLTPEQKEKLPSNGPGGGFGPGFMMGMGPGGPGPGMGMRSNW
jgi:Spy/CpxP family protein refolding chaperone